MADIFISYASGDRSRAEPLAKALEEQGWSVWWDRTIPPGKSFDQVIQEAIAAAKCVVVLWSEKSLISDWVKEEATVGKRRQILVPAKIDSVEPPLGFGLIQAADLTDWERETSHAGFESFVGAISEIVGPSPLKGEKAEEKRLEEDRKRKQEEERERKSEEDRRRKEQEEQALKAADEKRLKEQELKRKAEEERLKKEAEAKQKVEEDQKRKMVKEAPKTEKPETVKIKPSEPRKKSNASKFGVMAGVIVLLITGIWLYYKNQHEQQSKETQIKLERFYEQIEELERSIQKVANQEQLKRLYRQRDKLSDQVAAFSEQAAKFELESQLGQLEDRLKKFETQLANKEKELTAGRKGRIFVASAPDNATVKILNIDEPFQQGMELEPGKYHVEVSSEGYESQDRWIELGPGDEKRINFELAKIIQKVARLLVETVPEEATVRILNIKPKFSQGMELEPGSYHLEVEAEGYEIQRRWIDLAAGHEKPFRFELEKIKVEKPASAQKVFTNSIDMEFVLIPAGSFMIGSSLNPDEVAQKYGGKAISYKNEHPQHEVRISEPFYLQTTEVTVGQWRKFIKETGYKTEAETGIGPWTWDGSVWRIKKGTYWDNPGFSQDDRHPVTCVSWNDVQEFIRWLNRKEGADKHRLPTEAEWEYASRAGSTAVFSFGDDASKLTEYAWYNANSGNRTQLVAQKKANKWGLYDMHGNVGEWLEDDWHETYDGAPADGSAWVDKKRSYNRMMRGCGWEDLAQFCRSAHRQRQPPGISYSVLGFRLARSVSLGP